MYQSFEVRNFRCFEHLRIADCARVNLIAGANNVGKTSLLEALFIHSARCQPELTLTVSAMRGIESVKIEVSPWADMPWDYIFRDLNTSKEVRLTGFDEEKGRSDVSLRVPSDANELKKIGVVLEHLVDVGEGTPSTSSRHQVLELEYNDNKTQPGKYFLVVDRKGVRHVPPAPPLPFPTFFSAGRGRTPLAEDADRFGRMVVNKTQGAVVDALKLIEPRLVRLEIAVALGTPMIHGDIGLQKLMPIAFMGEGMVRLAGLVAGIGYASKGLMLIDEIENGLHHSILPKIWDAIARSARKFNTQVFATTHSLECINAAHQAFMHSNEYDFRLQRLEKVQNDIRVVSYDRQTLSAAIEAGLEVR